MHTYLYIFMCVCMDAYLCMAYDKYIGVEVYNNMYIDVTVVLFLYGYKYIPIYVFMCMSTCNCTQSYMYTYT